MALAYDRVMGDSMHPTLCQAFESLAVLHGLAPRWVADVGCGTGSFLCHVAMRGSRGYGVDRDPAMLAVAARKLRGLPVLLLQQDMTRLRLPRRVDLLTCNYDTLNYLLDVRALCATFRAFERALRSGGHVLFDLLTGQGDVPRGTTHQRIRLPDVHSDWRVHCDPSGTGSEVVMRSVVLTPGGVPRVEVERHRQRWYPQRLVLSLLRSMGLRPRGVYRFGTTARASPDTFWIQCLASKP